MKLAILALLTVTSLHTFAADISWGGKNGTNEIAEVSMRQVGETTTVRYAVQFKETRCERYRKDLCNKVVKFVDVVYSNESCLTKDDLVSCQTSAQSVTAILESGEKLDIESPEAAFRIKSIRQIEFSGGTLQEVAHLELQFEVWGNRADGLDPLVIATTGSLFRDRRVESVSKSLFSE